jgi:hypothetical protein
VLASTHGQPEEAVKANLRPVIDEAAEGSPEAVAGWLQALALVIPEAKHPVLDRLLSPAGFVELVATGDTDLPACVLERWIETENWEDLSLAAKEVHQRAVPLPNGGAANVVLRLAFVLGVVQPVRARELVDHVYETVPVDARRMIPLPTLDTMVSLGSEISLWDVEARRRLAAALEKSAWLDSDAKKPGARRLKAALAYAPPQSLVASVVGHDLPDLAKWSRISSKAQKPHGPQAQSRRVPVWAIVLALLCGMSALQALRKRDSPPRRPPPHFKDIDSINRRTRRPDETAEEYKHRLLEEARRLRLRNESTPPPPPTNEQPGR